MIPTRQYIYILAFILLGGILWASGKWWWTGHEWLGEAISVIGSLASLGGVGLALLQINQANRQIQQVATVAKATKEAVDQNRSDIRNFLSFSDIAHLIEAMKNTQHHVLSQDYRAAVILLQDVKDNLLRVNDEFGSFITENGIDLIGYIRTLNIDIASLVNHITEIEPKGRKTTIQPNAIHQNIEQAREIIIKIETSLRKKKL